MIKYISIICVAMLFCLIAQAQNIKNNYPEIFKQESGAMKTRLKLNSRQDSLLHVINAKALNLLDSVYASKDFLLASRKVKLEGIISERKNEIVQMLTQEQAGIFITMLESSQRRNKVVLNKTDKANSTQ